MKKTLIIKGLLYTAEFASIILFNIFISWMQSLVNADVQIEFSFAKFMNPYNWAIIIAQGILSLFIINSIMTHGYDERKNRVTSRLCKTLMTNELRVNAIYSRGLFDRLDEAVFAINESNKQECYLRHIHKVNKRIEWKDIEPLLTDHNQDIANIRAELISKFGIDKRTINRLNKVLDKIIGGQYRDYEALKSEDLLTKGVIYACGSKNSLKDKRQSVKTLLLLKNTLSFVALSGAMLLIVTELVVDVSIMGVVSNIVFLAMAAFKGLGAMSYICNYTLNLYDKRNDIFRKELGITDVWTPEEQVEEKEEKE